MYVDLADKQTRQVTQSMGDWAGFLSTAGRLYKYPFEEQLMIHAQRPDAVACASLEIWNRSMNRFIKAGSKGIALLDNSGGRSHLKYVFDVSDTQNRRFNARRPFLWEMKPEHETPVIEALKTSYDIDETVNHNNGNSLCKYLHNIAYSLSVRYYDDNKSDISYAVEDSFLHGLDEFNIGVAFKDALTVSTAYALMARCGVDPSDYIEDEDFKAVFDFNSPESVCALGKAVSTVSEEVLREIEVTIKKYERQKAVEMEGQRYERNSSQQQRNNIQQERGLSDSRHQDTPTEPVVEQVRDDAEGLSEQAQGDSIYNIQHERDAIPPLPGNREPSQPPSGLDDGEAISTEPATMQGNRPDGLDGAFEQPEIPSGRSHNQRADLQLDQDIAEPQDEPPSEQTEAANEGGFISSETFSRVGKSPDEQEPIETLSPLESDELSTFDNTSASEPMGQLSLSIFPTEQEQIEIIRGIRQVEQATVPPTTVAITQEDIDQAILEWNGDINSKIRTCEYMKEHARARDTANFLKAEFGSVSGLFTVEKEGADSITLPWTKVQRRIGQLMDEDKFLSADERVTVDNDVEADLDKPAEESVISPATAQNEPELEQEVVDAQPIQDLLGSPSPEFAHVTDAAEAPEPQDYSIWQDYQTISAEHRDSILFYRLGDSYEVMGSDANAVARFLNLTVTERDVGAERIPMVAIPVHSLDGYVEKLTNEGFGVAVWHNVDEITVHEGKPQSSVLEESPEIEHDSVAPTSVTQARNNFRITNDALGEGGAKTKYNMNVAAIRTLKTIEAENRLATPDEQETLSRYVGWGGIQQSFDSDIKKTGWGKEFDELKGLLTPEEYSSAKATTLNAHYTSPTVIKAMFETLDRLGFKEGNLLEPSMGVGNFFGLLPEAMQNAKLYGVELDSITGRIAKQLYQDASIKVMGFEKTDTPDAFFDAAIGNVPFGGYKVADGRYDKHNFNIHDYFFAKTLDQVRPGGIIAFVTSKGTLDKANPQVRKYIAQRAELLGAVRLPNNAFSKNAGTEVTSDIIFLQRREALRDIEPDWVHLGQTDDGIPINNYFVENPHMMLGTMSVDNGGRMYGADSAAYCKPFEEADLGEQLSDALFHIEGQFTEVSLDDLADEAAVRHSIPADPLVKNFSYALATTTDRVDEITGEHHARKIGEGDLYFRENSRMFLVEMPTATMERVRGMVELRDCVRKLMDLQLYDHPEHEITEQQAELNTLYDRFTEKNGLINSTANARAFRADSSYYLLASLEILDEDKRLERKSDMFSKRTIVQHREVTSVDTSSEALAVSIGTKAKVDIGYMARLTGFTPEKVLHDLEGVIFCDITNPNHNLPAFDPDVMKIYEKYPIVAADEYLSGNVREKLHRAMAFQKVAGDMFHGVNVAGNIRALEQAQPKDLDASEISVRCGSTWVDRRYYEQFMYEVLQTPRYLQDEIGLNFAEATGEWNITGKTRVRYDDVTANTTFGTSRVNAYKILEDTLNLRDVRIYDTQTEDGKGLRVINRKDTTLAAQKQDAIKQAFKDWVFQDPDRRRDLVQTYNERFNSTRTREYDGSHIQFSGMSPEITLKSHQTAAIARVLYGGNTLLAHEVGAGKSFQMIGAAMESKRLGLCNKSLIAVPGHLTEQMAGEFMRLYPSANLLVATKKDFVPGNRKKFCAKIATGDYDAVIIGHSQLEKIPLSKERQERLLTEQIDDITDAIEEMKRGRAERFTVKQMEKTKKSLEVRLTKLNDGKRKDDVVTFEQLGVDRLFVDESHSFKNLFMFTKMRNVAGLSQTEAQKSSDMFLKCRYMDEKTGSKGVIFATGTPITNSMAELYTVQRYLQYDTLQRIAMTHFDSWASTFGETSTSIELSPEGTGYRARTRFAKFQNLPELMNLFGEVADIKTADTLDLPRPKANFKTVVVPPTDIQREMVQELSARAKAVHERKVEPTEDNLLKITSDGRKIGLDQRLMNPMLPDDPNSKVNACMENVYRIWDETSADRLTQLVFCDFSTPNKDGRFNVYVDIRDKLLAKGIPENEVAFIHDYNTEAQKKDLFANVRSGKVRVLFGSTFKMGAGTNAQDRLVATHDLDCPWRPADLAQRAGRIVRQGNQNEEVDIYRYVTESTFDAYLFQVVEKKQEFISQIMTSKSPVRSCDDVDEEALSYAEIKALCAGNPAIKEKMNLDIEVSKLKLLKADYHSQHYRLQDDILQHFPKRIEAAKGHIEGFKADIERLEINTHHTEEGISPMVVDNKTYTDRGEAGQALIDTCKAITTTDAVKIGSYRGFDLHISFSKATSEFSCSMKGSMTHSTTLSNDPSGCISRINNTLDRIPERLHSSENQLQTLHEQLENAKTELAKPFAFEDDLALKSARLAEIDASLDMSASSSPVQAPEHDSDEPGQVASKNQLAPIHKGQLTDRSDAKDAKTKPSLLAALEKGVEKSRVEFGGGDFTIKSKDAEI